MSTLLVDNYDSFTFNLYQLLGELGADPIVHRNDALTLAEVRALAPDRILLSPGPGTPESPASFGICRALITQLGASIPILGVCLGHQGIVHAFGGRLARAPQPMHGRSSDIHHLGTGLYRDLPSPFRAMRYHSLIAVRDALPDCLEVDAWTDDGAVMGVRHRQWPVHGVQFHPESIGTPEGRRLVAAFVQRSVR